MKSSDMLGTYMSIFSVDTEIDECLTAVVFSFDLGSSYRLWIILLLSMSKTDALFVAYLYDMVSCSPMSPKNVVVLSFSISYGLTTVDSIIPSSV